MNTNRQHFVSRLLDIYYCNRLYGNIVHVLHCFVSLSCCIVLDSKIGANKASQVGSLHAATGVSRGGSFALKLIPTLHIVRSV